MNTNTAWAVWTMGTLGWVLAGAVSLGIMSEMEEMSKFERRFCWSVGIFGLVWVAPVALRALAMVLAA